MKITSTDGGYTSQPEEVRSLTVEVDGMVFQITESGKTGALILHVENGTMVVRPRSASCAEVETEPYCEEER